MKKTESIEMWCDGCKEVVEAVYYEDLDTGFCEYQCPADYLHTVTEIGRCQCGEPMGSSDYFCPSCEHEIKDGFMKFIKSLPVGIDPYDATHYAIDEMLGDF